MAYLSTEETSAITQNRSSREWVKDSFTRLIHSCQCHFTHIYVCLYLQLPLDGFNSVAFFFFSCHQYLFLLLFYRIAVSWLSYSVSAWSLGQHVWRFSPAITHLSSFWGFGNLQNHPVSLKIYASLVIAKSKSVLNIKSEDVPRHCI